MDDDVKKAVDKIPHTFLSWLYTYIVYNRANVLYITLCLYTMYISISSKVCDRKELCHQKLCVRNYSAFTYIVTIFGSNKSGLGQYVHFKCRAKILRTMHV